MYKPSKVEPIITFLSFQPQAKSFFRNQTKKFQILTGEYFVLNKAEIDIRRKIVAEESGVGEDKRRDKRALGGGE